MATTMPLIAALLVACSFSAQAKIGQECHPMDEDHPKKSDLFNCHRDCNWFTEWCVPSSASSTGWACDKAHQRGEAQPGQSCVAGGGTIFCSNCPDGYFCQNDGEGTSTPHWECDVMSEKQAAEEKQAKVGNHMLAENE